MNPSFGSALASAGDVDGDGFADMIFGAPSDGDDYIVTGGAFLYFGGAGGLTKSAVPLPRPTADTGTQFGVLVAGAGDVDGDGHADLLAATEVGSYLYFGSPGGPSKLPLALMIPGGANNSGGEGALAGGGDIDGDGFAEVLVGSPWANGNLGNAFVYMGGSKGPGVPMSIANPGAANGIFGASAY
jgi:hypothetical protein